MYLVNTAGAVLLSLWMAIFNIEVQRMDSDVWRERKAAHKVVKEMVMHSDLCAMKLREVQKKHPSLEVRTRARRIMGSYYNSVFPEGGFKKMPCLDMIPNRDERKAACKKYLRPLDEYGNRGYHPDYEPMRYATYYYITEKMKNGMSRADAKKLMNDMWEEERQWEKDNPWTYCYDYHLQQREDR